MARRKLHLHGPLRKYAPDGIELEADTVLEAINGMCKLLGIKPNPLTGRSLVRVRGFDTLESLSQPSEERDLHIVPAFLGGKSVLGSIVRIVVGAVLIVAAVVIAGMTFGLATPLSSFLFSVGASLVLGGLINLLFPQKPADTSFSHYLGGGGNTTKIGTRIGLPFGKQVRIFGQILSYNLQAVQT